MMMLRYIVALPLAATLCVGIARAETMEQAMTEAYLGNPILDGVRAQLRATDELVASALAAKRPVVLASLAYSRFNGKMGVFIANNYPVEYSHFNYNPKTATLLATQPIYRGGALDAALRAAESQVAVQQAQLTASEQSILNSVGTACADLIQTSAILKLAEEYEAALVKLLNIANIMLLRQNLTITDKAQAESRLADARAQVKRASAQFAVARFAFQTVVGRPPDGIPPPVAFAIPVHSKESALQSALTDNPNIVAANHAVIAAEAGTDIAVGRWLPSIDLIAQYDYAKDGSADTLLQRDMTFNGQLTIPIYAGGADTSRIRQADDLVSQARFNLSNIQDAVTAAAFQAWQRVLTADNVLAARQRQVEATNRSLEGVKKLFDRGDRRFYDILNALQESITARTSLLAAERDITLTRLQLLSAIGGLTAQSLNLPVPLYDPAKHLQAAHSSLLDIGE